jgi:hypothetical protein
MNFYTIDGVAVISAAEVLVTMRDGTEFTITGEVSVTAFLNWYNAEYEEWKRRG